MVTDIYEYSNQCPFNIERKQLALVHGSTPDEMIERVCSDVPHGIQLELGREQPRIEELVCLARSADCRPDTKSYGTYLIIATPSDRSEQEDVLYVGMSTNVGGMSTRTKNHLNKSSRKRESAKVLYTLIDDAQGPRTPTALALLKTEYADRPYIRFSEGLFSQLLGSYAALDRTRLLRARNSYQTSGISTYFLGANVSDCFGEGDLDPDESAELLKYRKEQKRIRKEENRVLRASAFVCSKCSSNYSLRWSKEDQNGLRMCRLCHDYEAKFHKDRPQKFADLSEAKKNLPEWDGLCAIAGCPRNEDNYPKSGGVWRWIFNLESNGMVCNTCRTYHRKHGQWPDRVGGNMRSTVGRQQRRPDKSGICVHDECKSTKGPWPKYDDHLKGFICSACYDYWRYHDKVLPDRSAMQRRKKTAAAIAAKSAKRTHAEGFTSLFASSKRPKSD